MYTNTIELHIQHCCADVQRNAKSNKSGDSVSLWVPPLHESTELHVLLHRLLRGDIANICGFEYWAYGIWFCSNAA